LQKLPDRIWSGTDESLVKIKAVIHEAEEGGYWAEVPAIPGCASQGKSPRSH
jgi:hypothetical protein